MQRIAMLLPFIFLSMIATAQKVYTITADSTLLTGCDSNELIIENHSRTTKGFLFNTGNGRTVFKKGIVKINDSVFVIGADTFRYNAWVQGGNRWGKPGILGTLDTNYLSFITNNVERMRLTKAGKLLLGTTTDNGNLLQVNGRASFTDSVNIGTATIAKNGNLIGTNALLFNYVVPKFHNYRGNSDPYIGRLENVIYAYNSRLQTTSDTTGGVTTINIVFPSSEIVPGYAGLTYGQGFFIFSFWNNGIPQSVAVSVYDSLTSSWVGPFSSSTNIGYGGSGFFQVSIPACNFITRVKAVITPQPGIGINLQDMEYLPQNGSAGLASGNPYLTKDNWEFFYYPLTFRSNYSDVLQLNPWGASYFKNNLVVGSATDNGSGAKLQVTGNVNLNGNLGLGVNTPAAQLHTTGLVRFAGLTSNTAPTHVLVSDANGYLFYRDASTLAVADAVHSSLAVNGPIKARSLTIEAPAKDHASSKEGSWPDYVFDSSYHLPPLAAVDSFITRHGHLPDIASATEVAAHGIDVGKHEAALLKKVEELTIYIIQQSHEMETMNRRLDALTQQIEELKKSSRKK